MAQARSSLIFSEQEACVTSLCVCRGLIYGKGARALHEVAGHDLPCLARGLTGHRPTGGEKGPGGGVCGPGRTTQRWHRVRPQRGRRWAPCGRPASTVLLDLAMAATTHPGPELRARLEIADERHRWGTLAARSMASSMRPLVAVVSSVGTRETVVDRAWQGW